MNRSLNVLVLVLMLGLAALVAGTGTANAAGATRTTYTWVQFPIAEPYGGRTWTEGRITHMRDVVCPTLALWTMTDSAGNTCSWATLIYLTINSNVNEDGVGPTWGTWTEYEFDLATWTPGALLVEDGLWHGKQSSAMIGPPPQHEYAVVNILGTGFGLGLDRGWGHMRATAVCYTGVDPNVSPSGLLFVGEGSFLVPGGK